jgi:uncharacterized Zn-finger protein
MYEIRLKSKLVYHKNVNSGDKPHICPLAECHFRFARSDELTRHLRKHVGVKPFRCFVCDRCFARSDHLKVIHSHVIVYIFNIN